MSVTVSETIDLPDRVLEIARTDPHRLAVIDVGRPLLGRRRHRTTTYAQLSRRAEATAAGLGEIGVGKGTLCSFMVPPCEDALVLALALWRVGAVMVGIEPHSHGLRTVARCLARVGPEVFFGAPEAHLARRVYGWGRGTIRTDVVVGGPAIPGVRTLASLEREPPSTPPAAQVGPDDAAIIAFTTGSTGAPKPTVMTQRNVVSMISAVGEQWGLGADGHVVDMPTFPGFWIIGLFHGGTVVVPPMDFATRGPADADPALLAETIRTHDVGSMFASPALLANLASHCGREGITLPSIRRIVAGGAEVQGPLYAAVKPVIPNGEIYSDYGATEALPLTEIAGSTVLAETWRRTEAGDGLCVGRPLPGAEVRIIAVDDGPVATMADAHVLPVGSIGEVVARGPHISDRYFDPDDDRDNKIPDGDGRWHRLGDLGWLDDQGRLWVCGRRSHRVVTAERTYHPLCCEPVFNAHPDVVRSALTGQAAPVICVELRPEALKRADRVRGELAELAERHEATRGITDFAFLTRLPVDRRHNAKIDRPALTAALASGRISVGSVGDVGWRGPGRLERVRELAAFLR